MEVRKRKETVTELREVKAPEETMKPGKQKREEGFQMIKGGKGYTIADIEALPEGERAELIDGEMFRMDAPTLTHQDLLVKLLFEIELHIRKNKGPCRVLPAPFGVYIKKDDRNYVEPDISVICDRDRLDQKGCHGAPDWVIEIMSPSSVKMDSVRKVKLYQEAGVREYWIVDSGKETVSVYDFERGKAARGTDIYAAGTCAAAPERWDAPMLYSFSERVKAGIFKDLYLEISQMDFM